MKTKRFVILILSVFFLASAIPAAQKDSGVSGIFLGNGYLMIWNLDDLHFTIEVKGKTVKPLDSRDHVFFQVDGIVLQLGPVAIKEFAKNAKEQKLSDQAILAAHRDWESDYIGNTLGKKLKVESSPQKLPNGGEALLWKYAMPEGISPDAKTQMYLTMVSGSHIVLLNGVVGPDMEESTVQKLLMDTAATLKISAEPIDVKKLSDTIKNGKPE